MLFYICSSTLLLGLLYICKPKKVKMCCKLSYITTTTIAKFCYISFLQYMNSSIKKIGKNTYEITYIINGNLYKMIIVPKRGPSPILQISDENMNDVTDEIMAYLGPEFDWHGKKFSLEFFKKESLTFEFSDGTSKTFSLDNVLHIE
jgi:hypothetical protein